MSPRKTAVEQNKGVFEVEWPMFGELSRALALKVVRDYDPDIVIGVATAGVVPGAVIAAIMDREFHSIIVSRRYQSATVRDTPAVFGAVPTACPRPTRPHRRRDLRLGDDDAPGGRRHRERRRGRGAHSRSPFKTGAFEPDYHALATESTIVLPWDREVLFQGELVPNPLYRETLGG
jgi:hypothetical protein